MMPPYSWSTPGRKPGISTNVTSGILKALQKRTNPAPLSDASISRAPASTFGWLATIPTVAPRMRQLAILTCDLCVALLLYELLKPVGRNLSLLAAFFRVVFVAIAGANVLDRKS